MSGVKCRGVKFRGGGGGGVKCRGVKCRITLKLTCLALNTYRLVLILYEILSYISVKHIQYSDTIRDSVAIPAGTFYLAETLCFNLTN